MQKQDKNNLKTWKAGRNAAYRKDFWEQVHTWNICEDFQQHIFETYVKGFG